MPIQRGGASDFTANVRAGAETNAAVSAASASAAGAPAPKKSSSGGGRMVSAGAGAVVTQSATAKSSGLQPIFARATASVVVSTKKSIDPFSIGIIRGGSKIIHSDDGVTWQTKTNNISSIISTTLYAIAWNGSMWMIVGDGNFTIATSPDGLTWTGRPQTYITNGFGVCWTGSKWFVFGDSTTNTVISSADGITWEPNGITINPYGTLGAIATNKTRIVAVCNGALASSTNGTSWTAVTLGVNSAYYKSVATNGTKWFATGDAKTITSTDGIAWTRVSGGSFVDLSNTNGVDWVNGLWIVSGYNGTLTMQISADNGLTWRSATVANAGGVLSGTSVAWNGKKYLLIGTGGGSVSTYAYSTDAMNWTGSLPFANGIAPSDVASKNILYDLF